MTDLGDCAFFDGPECFESIIPIFGFFVAVNAVHVVHAVRLHLRLDFHAADEILVIAHLILLGVTKTARTFVVALFFPASNLEPFLPHRFQSVRVRAEHGFDAKEASSLGVDTQSEIVQKVEAIASPRPTAADAQQ